MSDVRHLVPAIVAAAFAGVLQAQPLPLGDTFQVNTFTESYQFLPALAAGSSGALVVWQSPRDGDAGGVFAQRYDGAWQPVGGELQVNAATMGDQREPAVAVDPGGNFLVAFAGMDGASRAILLQRLASDGSAMGTEFQVNEYTFYQGPYEPVIAVNSAGNFMVVWTDYEIFGQRFDSVGAKVGSQLHVNSTTVFTEQQPAITADGAGNFIVVWQDGTRTVRGQRYDSAGAPLGSEFQVGDIPYDPAPFQNTVPSVAADDSGNFVVVWHRSEDSESEDTIFTDVIARLYDSAGQPRGSEFQITGKHRGNYLPDVAMNGSGEFVVTWDEYVNGAYGLDVVGRRFSSSGTPIADDFVVNTNPAQNTGYSQVVFTDEDQLAVVWDIQTISPNPDIFGRRFATSVTTPICSSGAIIANAQAKVAKLAAPGGDEKLLLKGELQFPAGTPAVFDPATKGAQVLVEDLGAGNAVLFELSANTVPIAGGAGCGSEDGWSANGSGTTFTYKTKTDALPPGCLAGSANGLVLIKMKDKRDSDGVISFKVKVKDGSIGTPVGPLRVTVVLGASVAESAAGECGALPFPSEICAAKGASFKCKQ
jgi:hypothetical protein